MRNWRLHRFTPPTSERYAQVEVLEEGMELVMLNGAVVPVAELFLPLTSS